MKRNYLYPKIWRRGASIITYVEKNGKNFELGTRVNLNAIEPGTFPKGDQFVNRKRISEAFYKAFIAEAKANYARYRLK